MKKLIILLFASVAVGCQEIREMNPEQKGDCYQCVKNTTIKRNDGFADEHKQEQLTQCNLTQEQVFKIEELGTYQEIIFDKKTQVLTTCNKVKP